LIGRFRARGFKTKFVDILNPIEFAELLIEHHCKIIQLQRRNTVKAAISTINARRLWEKSGNWNLLNEEDRLSSFDIDPVELDHLLAEREGWDKEVEQYSMQLGLPTLKLTYEELLIDDHLFISKILDFLGVRLLSVDGKTYKNTSDKLSDVINNFDALRSRYAHTKYGPMFDEVLVD
jgi:LPS sulfotransferase NodH